MSSLKGNIIVLCYCVLRLPTFGWVSAIFVSMWAYMFYLDDLVLIQNINILFSFPAKYVTFVHEILSMSPTYLVGNLSIVCFLDKLVWTLQHLWGPNIHQPSSSWIVSALVFFWILLSLVLQAVFKLLLSPFYYHRCLVLEIYSFMIVILIISWSYFYVLITVFVLRHR